MCRWKRSLQLGVYGVDTMGNTLPMANRYLFANILLLTSGEGNKATSPFFQLEMH